MAGAGNPIKGSRIGAGPMGEAERGYSAPRQEVQFFCSNGHVTELAFAHDAVVPESWDCPTCGLPTGTDASNPPPPTRTEPFKTHLAYVKERRSESEAKVLLEEAVKLLRTRRKSGDVIF